MSASLLAVILIAYLLGSIPFTQVVAKLVKGVDLRQVGSRNVGGRNLTHQLGLGWGLLGGGLDVLKGAAALGLARVWLGPLPLGVLAGVAVVAGHNWPVWLKFRGGKGLATVTGVMLMVAPLETVLTFAIGTLILRLTGNMLITTLAGFGALYLLTAQFEYPPEIAWLILGLFATVVLAALPEIIEKLRTSGGVREYMRHPNRVYEEEARARKPSPKGKEKKS